MSRRHLKSYPFSPSQIHEIKRCSKILALNKSYRRVMIMLHRISGSLILVQRCRAREKRPRNIKHPKHAFRNLVRAFFQSINVIPSFIQCVWNFDEEYLYISSKSIILSNESWRSSNSRFGVFLHTAVRNVISVKTILMVISRMFLGVTWLLKALTD